MGWRHIIIGTRCSWLHGDRRGFRSRDHRLHSSGDYKAPPPEGEHEGLLRYHKGRSQAPINFDTHVRVVICETFNLKMQSLGLRIIACSVGKRHLHAVAEMMRDYGEIEKAVGKCKQRSSHAVRGLLPGTIWAAGGKFLLIADAGHLHNAFHYVRFDQEPGAIVWSHKPEENWIENPSVGIIVMGPDETHLRLFQAGV